MKETSEEAAKAALAEKRKAAEEQRKLDEMRRDVPPGIETVEEELRKAKNVRAKLLFVQRKMRVAKNRGAGHSSNAGVSYEYRNAEDILEAAKPLCEEVGALLTIDVQPMIVGENLPIDVREVRPAPKNEKGVVVGTPTYARAFGPRFLAVATAVFTDCETGECVKCRAFAEIDFWRKGQTEPEKLCGSADSYASKYALGHLFALDNNRDADMESDERGKKSENPF